MYHHSKKNYTVVEDGDRPKLECIIIISFGKSPPNNVAVKKASGDFLEGVGEDMEIMQSLIRRDNDKELSKVVLECHFKQTKIKDFEAEVQRRMVDIKLTREYGRENTSACQKGCKCGMHLPVH